MTTLRTALGCIMSAFLFFGAASDAVAGVTKTRLGNLKKNDLVVTGVEISENFLTNDVAEAVEGVLSNAMQRVRNIDYRVNVISNTVNRQNMSNDVVYTSMRAYANLTSALRQQVSNLTSVVESDIPAAALAQAVQKPPVIRVDEGAGYGFYVLCRDGEYHDLRDTLLSGFDAYGHARPQMTYTLSSLYGRTFTPGYLSSNLANNVTWTSNLVASAANIARPISAVCGGTGYPKCYGREATVRELLCDILYSDRSVWEDAGQIGAYGNRLVSLENLADSEGTLANYARGAHAAVAQLRRDYERGPAFGTPIRTYVRRVSSNGVTLDITPDTVDCVEVSNAVSSVSFRPVFSSAASDPRAVGCRVFVTVGTTTVVRVSGRLAIDRYVGRTVFTAAPGSYMLAVDRVFANDSGVATYCATFTDVNYQRIAADYTTNNVTLVTAVDSRVAAWAKSGQPEPDGVASNVASRIAYDAITNAVNAGYLSTTGITERVAESIAYDAITNAVTVGYIVSSTDLDTAISGVEETFNVGVMNDTIRSAITTNWIPSVSNMNSQISAAETRAKNASRSNTWLPTATQVGALPDNRASLVASTNFAQAVADVGTKMAKIHVSSVTNSQGWSISLSDFGGVNQSTLRAATNKAVMAATDLVERNLLAAGHEIGALSSGIRKNGYQIDPDGTVWTAISNHVPWRLTNPNMAGYELLTWTGTLYEDSPDAFGSFINLSGTTGYARLFPIRGNIRIKQTLTSSVPWNDNLTNVVFYTNGVVAATVSRDRAWDLVYTNRVGRLMLDDYTALTNSTSFCDAVEAVSPPVVLPQTWALADVTNASGESVTAKDVGAVGSSMELYGEYVTTRSFEEVPAPSSWAQRNGWYPTVLYQYSNTLSHAEDSFGLLYHEGNIAGPYYALCTGKNGNIWSLPRRPESNYHHELLDDASTIPFSKVDHPTTLDGYGLSGDAYTKTQANNTFLGKNDTADRAKSLYVPSSGFSVGLRPRIYYDEETMKWCFSDTYDAYSIAAAEDIYTKTEIDDAIQDAKEFSVNHADTDCLSKTGGVINGSLRVSDGVSFGTTGGLNPVVTDEMGGTEFLFTTFAGGTKESALRPDGSYILTKTSAKEEYPILTNAYTKAETEDKFLGADSIRYTSVTNGVNGFKFYLVWSNTGVLTSYVTNAPSAFCGFFVDYDYIHPEGWGYTLKCDLSGSYSQSPVIATRGGGLWYVDAWASQFFTGNPTGDLDFEQEAAGHAVDAYSLAGICQSQVIGWVAEKFAPVKTYGLSMVTNSNANGNTRLYIENDSVKIDDEWGSMTHYDRMQAEKDGITVTSATNVNNNATVTLEYAKYTPKAIKFYSKVDGTVQANATYKFPTGVTGTRTLATQSATSLAAMLNDVATNETVQVASAGEMTDAEAVASVRSNICCFVRSDVTQTVNKVKAEFWDDQLQVNWTLRMVNGEMKLYATTNTNMSVAN